MNSKKEKFSFVNFIMLTFAGIINAIGVNMFLAPVNLYDSGFSGTSMLLSQISSVSLSIYLILINFPFFIYGYKKQGICFTLYSLYAVLIYSLASFVINDIIPIDVSAFSPFAGDDLFLCAIFGGLISGVGSGLTIRFGGAIDGVEVLAVIFAKNIGITVGTFVMIYNSLLYIVAGIFLKSWILPLYSIVTYFAGLKTIDFIVEGFDKEKAAMIITTKAKQISARLSEEFGSGITIIDAHGYYSSENKEIIYFVLNRFQISRLRKIVNEEDNLAFISISEVSEVFSKGIKK